MHLPRPISKFLAVLDKGFRILMRPFQIVSNFVILTVSYFLGIGISSVFYKLGPGKKKAVFLPNSYWQAVPSAPKDKDAWQRPF